MDPIVRTLALTICLTSGLVCSHACGQLRAQAPDSVARPEMVLLPRFNSAGHFPFTGAILNRNINFDVNLFYEHRGYGFFLFKSFDLQDRHSYVNYFQPGVFKKIQLAPAFKLGFFFGYLFSQTQGFRDADSDYYAAVVAYWNLHERLRLENTALYFDFSQSDKLANRMLLSWTLNKFRADFYLWHRVVFDDNTHATSASAALNFPRIRITDAVFTQTTLSYQGYLTRSKPDFARRDGFLLTIAFPVQLLPPTR